MILSGNRGLALLFTGDHASARSCFREELLLARELVVRPVAAEALDGLAAIAAARGDAGRAAMLAGAAEAVGRDAQQDDVVARIETTFLAPARTDSGAWETAAREGGALGFEEAIAYGLE
jgi:hypothetical protein